MRRWAMSGSLTNRSDTFTESLLPARAASGTPASGWLTPGWVIPVCCRACAAMVPVASTGWGRMGSTARARIVMPSL